MSEGVFQKFGRGEWVRKRQLDGDWHWHCFTDAVAGSGRNGGRVINRDYAMHGGRDLNAAWYFRERMYREVISISFPGKFVWWSYPRSFLIQVISSPFASHPVCNSDVADNLLIGNGLAIRSHPRCVVVDKKAFGGSYAKNISFHQKHVFVKTVLFLQAFNKPLSPTGTTVG